MVPLWLSGEKNACNFNKVIIEASYKVLLLCFLATLFTQDMIENLDLKEFEIPKPYLNFKMFYKHV